MAGTNLEGPQVPDTSVIVLAIHPNTFPIFLLTIAVLHSTVGRRREGAGPPHAPPWNLDLLAVGIITELYTTATVLLIILLQRSSLVDGEVVPLRVQVAAGQP